MGHVRQLVGFAPRPMGSPGLAKAADYLTGRIEAMGLTAHRHEFEWTGPGLAELAPGTLPDPVTVRNIWTVVPAPAGKDAPWIAFGAHYDSKLTAGHANADHNFTFEGAIDGGGGPAVLLELVRALKDRPDNKCNWMFIWFDGEESVPFDWDNDQSLIGSTRFAEDFSKTNEHFPERALINNQNRRLKALILLDLIGSKDIKIDRDTSSLPKDLVEVFAAAAKSLPSDQGARVFTEQGNTNDDHIPFQKRGVHTCLLIDFQHRIPPGLGGNTRAPTYNDYDHWWHTPADNLNQMSPEALELAGNLVWFAIPGLEARYAK
jgi:Zn-dependent M28 family amino/carboxypeptidase